MAAIVAEYKVQRRSLMEATASHNKDLERFVYSNVPELARMVQTISILQLCGVFPESPHLLHDCVRMCTAILEDATSLAIYHRAHVLKRPLSDCIKEIYCPVWQSLLEKWAVSLNPESSRCEVAADRPLEAFLTRLVVLWAHFVVAQVLRSVAVCDDSHHSHVVPTRRIQVAEYQPDNTTSPPDVCTDKVELPKTEELQWWALCLPPELVVSVASDAASVLQRAARLWTEEDLGYMESVGHTLVLTKTESTYPNLKGCLKLVSVVECSLQGVQQGAVTAKGPVIRSALSALSHYLSQLNKSLSEYTWTSPSQQAKLHLVIEASHFVHSRMSDYVNLFEEDSQWNKMFTSLLLQAAKLCDSATDGLIKQQVTVFMSYLAHDGASNNWSNPKPFHEGERCSFPVQMLNYQLRGLLHSLECLAPERVVAKVACVVLSETLTFMADRYACIKPSFARTKQLRADLILLLSMTSAMLPRLAPLEYSAAHYLAVHLDRVHHACTRLLSLLAVLTSPLHHLVQALKEAASNGREPGRTLTSYPTQKWLGFSTGPLQQPSAFLHSLSAGSGSSVHLVNAVAHVSQALAPSASLVLHVLLYNSLSLCNLLLPAAVVASTPPSRTFNLHVLTLLSHAHNSPKALADAANIMLKMSPDNPSWLLSDVVCSSVVGEWLCRHFTPLAVTAQLYDKAVAKLAPQVMNKEEFVRLFLEDLELVVLSQGAPVLHLLSAIAERCSTDVAEVLLVLVSNCCSVLVREAPTEGGGVVDTVTSAPNESSLRGAVQSWREGLGQRVKEQLQGVNHVDGLSVEEELEAATMGFTSELAPSLLALPFPPLPVPDLPVKWMCHTLTANKDSLRHALLQTEPTTQPVLLAFSEPDGSHVPFNPVEEMGQVGDVHLQQSTLMSHQCDLRGVLSAILSEGGWDDIVSMAQYRAEFLPDAQLEESEVVLVEYIKSCTRVSTT